MIISFLAGWEELAVDRTGSERGGEERRPWVTRGVAWIASMKDRLMLVAILVTRKCI